MRIGLAQINPTVGDIGGNTELIWASYQQAVKKGCDLVIFPELALPGYPPEDLLFKPAFIEANLKALKTLASQFHSAAAVLGFVDKKNTQLFNAAAWIQNGKVSGIYHKQQLPNYGVFDEKRYFSVGTKYLVKPLQGYRVGVTICEDIWVGTSALSPLKKMKPDIVVNISASPFHAGKIHERYTVAGTSAHYLKAPVLYCNMIGGQDELVFDGGSFSINAQKKVETQAGFFKSDIYSIEVEKKGKKIQLKGNASKPLTGVEEIYQALLLGITDYVRKNDFKKVVVGLSGGIDSALVAALAAKALGPDQVIGITMPSKFNLNETKQDAKLLAQNLQIRFLEIPIQKTFETFLEELKPVFQGTQPNITEENLQARIRGTILMSLSNKFNWLVLTTGNKSETSTGYCTLYGDTAGGFAVLKDVLKTTVYELAKFINQKEAREIIPVTTIQRAPTAELKLDQKDEDSLGPYAHLDPVIVGHVEKNLSPSDIVGLTSQTPEYVNRIINLIDRNEYKRRQAPPGIKITPRSFGRDHRMPITNRYRQT